MRLRDVLKPNTLVKKCVYGIAGVTLIMLIGAGNIMPDCVYYLLKPRMQQDFKVLTSAVATKISYLLHQNTQYLLKFWQNEELCSQIVQYTQGEPDQTVKEEIEERLKGERRGKDEPGAILSSRDILVIVDWEEMVCKPEMEPYGEIVMESEWFSGLKEVLTEAPTYEHDHLKRRYSPVFPAEGETEEFLSFAMLKEMEDHEIILLMIEPFQEYRSLFEDLLQADIEDFCLIGWNEEILFHNKEDSIFCGKKPDELTDLFYEEQYETKLIEEEDVTVIGVRLSYQMEQLKLATALSKDEFLKPYRPFAHMINLMFVIFTVLLLILVMMILNGSLLRLKKLVVQMKAVRGEAYHVPRSIRGDDEIGQLAGTFYQMMDEIQENVEKIKEQEKREKRIEYSLLVSQIDPHFIYNTLNTITYLAELNQTEDIMIINKALIGMLRDRLKMTKLQIYDTIEKEKQQLEAYMTIQKYLCNNEITLEFPIPEECADIRYPKNILQPLVENSILHGILLHRDSQGSLIPGKIEISVKLFRECVVTEIKDNGIGMTDEEIQKYFYEEAAEEKAMANQPAKEHIGIYNIRMRMKYLYGKKFYIRAKQREEGGLRIRMEFPIQKM